MKNYKNQKIRFKNKNLKKFKKIKILLTKNKLTNKFLK